MTLVLHLTAGRQNSLAEHLVGILQLLDWGLLAGVELKSELRAEEDDALVEIDVA